MFKKWNSVYPHSQIDCDSPFLIYLLLIVFGADTLKKSSALGKKARNANVRHKALDPELLAFVEGMCPFVLEIDGHSYLILYHDILVFADVFNHRVGKDKIRQKRFLYLVNSKCKNLRRTRA